jgi:hypothetical protein
VGPVMLQLEAKELGGDWVVLDLIKGGRGRDEKVEVVAILVLDPKIVDD